MKKSVYKNIYRLALVLALPILYILYANLHALCMHFTYTAFVNSAFIMCLLVTYIVK